MSFTPLLYNSANPLSRMRDSCPPPSDSTKSLDCSVAMWVWHRQATWLLLCLNLLLPVFLISHNFFLNVICQVSIEFRTTWQKRVVGAFAQLVGMAIYFSTPPQPLVLGSNHVFFTPPLLSSSSKIKEGTKYFHESMSMWLTPCNNAGPISRHQNGHMGRNHRLL